MKNITRMLVGLMAVILYEAVVAVLVVLFCGEQGMTIEGAGRQLFLAANIIGAVLVLAVALRRWEKRL